ncbi:MAG: leucine-rich repeat domain-containing protein [Limisphaerales bacterium]
MRGPLFLLLGCALCCAPMLALGQRFGDFTYATNAGSATITGYTGSGGVVVIPGAIYGLPVAAIGDRVFFYMPGVTAVTIPDSVRSVGESAFDSCGLTSLTIPDGVTNIGLSAFEDCIGLTNVTIPDSVASLGLEAFRDCTNLITPPAVFSYTTVDGALTVTDWDGSGSAVTIPSTINGLPVTAIGAVIGGPLWGGFYLPDWVTNLTIPDGIARIGDQTFIHGVGLRGHDPRQRHQPRQPGVRGLCEHHGDKRGPAERVLRQRRWCGVR